jgi:hypothetical protein
MVSGVIELRFGDATDAGRQEQRRPARRVAAQAPVPGTNRVSSFRTKCAS